MENPLQAACAVVAAVVSSARVHFTIMRQPLLCTNAHYAVLCTVVLQTGCKCVRQPQVQPGFLGTSSAV